MTANELKQLVGDMAGAHVSPAEIAATLDARGHLEVVQVAVDLMHVVSAADHQGGALYDWVMLHPDAWDTYEQAVIALGKVRRAAYSRAHAAIDALTV